MRRRTFLRTLPLVAGSIPACLWGNDDGLLPVVGRIHTLLLPDQTRLVLELDGECPISLLQGNPASVTLQGALYLPMEDSKRFSSGPLKAMRIFTPSDEMFKTVLELDTSMGATVHVKKVGTPPRILIDVFGASISPTTAPLSPEMAHLQEKARRESAELRDLSSTGELDLRIRNIVIDPGHGGHDPGAVGKAGAKEKDITLLLGLKLAKAIEKQSSAKTYLTRTEDYYLNLSDRTTTANQYRADLFLSLHCNAAENRKARGSETFFCSDRASDKEAARVAAYENSFAEPEETQREESPVNIEWVLFKLQRKLLWEDSSHLARQIQADLGRQLPVKDRGTKSAGFFVLRKAKMPSILVEAAFISNPQEEQLLSSQTFQETFVGSLLSQLKPYLA